MELTLKLTEQEGQVVLNALITQPYVEVVDVINKIQQQASEQMSQSGKNPFFAEPKDGEGNGV